MARWIARGERPVHWVGSAKKDLLAFPAEIVDDFGYALGVVQFGGMPPSAKPWHGEGAGVFELSEECRGSAYRVVYTVRFQKAVFVLHCFQKKATSGVKTARRHVVLIRQRLRTAQENYEGRHGEETS